MKKISVLALLATLGLAAPALAQTPADMKNNRVTAKEETATAPVKLDTKNEAAAKPAKKSKKKSKKKSSKKAAAAPAAADAAKKDEKHEEKK